MSDMNHAVALPDLPLDEILTAFLGGQAKLNLARRYNVPLRTIEDVLRVALPSLDERALQLSRREQYARLEDMQRHFAGVAKETDNPQAALVVSRIGEQLAALVGLNAPASSAVTVVNQAQGPSNVELLSKLRTKLALLDIDPSHLAAKAREQAALGVVDEGLPSQ